jgi:acyl dehydratase
VVDADDAEIWRSRSTYFVRGAPAPEGADDVAEAPPEPDPHVGRLPHAIWTIPGDIGRRYAAVSGDVNPIHVNGLAAKAFGMPGTIAHGMWTKARALAALAGRYGPAFTVDVVFKAPVRAPSRAYFHTAAADGGWDAKLVSTKGRDHLLMTLREG